MQIAGTEVESEMMRWSDYHYYPNSFSVASYDKPASVLYALKGILGDELFLKAHREFMERWKYKHPYPWDFFRTIEDVTRPFLVLLGITKPGYLTKELAM